MLHSKILYFFLLLALFGCGSLPISGPDYQPPEMPIVDNWEIGHSPEGVSGVKFSESNAELEQWWRVFGDPALEQVVEEVLAVNQDLRTAQSRIIEARALAVVAGVKLYPEVNVAGKFTRARRSAALLERSFDSAADGDGAGFSALTTNLFQGGFDASWELDLFGGTRRSVEAAEADLAAVTEQESALRISLSAEVIKNYFELRGFEENQAIVEKNIRVQQENLELVRQRFIAGLVSELDVLQAQAQLSSTTATLPIVKSKKNGVILRLAVLAGRQATGEFAQRLNENNRAFSDLKERLPNLIAIGLPSDSLRQRPDIRAAERALAGSTARIGVAVADLYPKFSISAVLGLQSPESNTLLQSSSRYWSFAPGVSWPVFDAGRIRAQIEVQGEREEQALMNYEKTVLIALEEVGNALIGLQQEQVRASALEDAVAANNKALELARELYSSGVIDFQRVLDAERQLFLAEDELVNSYRTVLLQFVALNKSLGGEQLARKLAPHQ